MTWKNAVLEATLLLAFTPLAARGADRVVEVLFHGNYSISDTEMERLAGVHAGLELKELGPEEIRARLLRTGRFEWVRVERRYRSLLGGDVILLVSVKERTPVAKKFMVAPILRGSDEYGLEYGARLTSLNLLGTGERISFPLTWGGVRRAAVESRFDRGEPVLSAFLAGAGISDRENPHYKIRDRRTEAAGGVVKNLGRLRFEAGAGWSDVRFGALNTAFPTQSAGVALDTRADAGFPRDAVYAGFGWERLGFGSPWGAVHRCKFDLRGYKGLGRPVLAGQFVLHTADASLPAFQQPFLGGSATLRGHPPGELVGDNLALASLELRMPLNSALAIHRAGVDFFFDSGAVYNHGRRLGDAAFKHGAGVGFFLFIAGFGFKLDVAHDLHHRVRLHFSTSFRF